MNWPPGPDAGAILEAQSNSGAAAPWRIGRLLTYENALVLILGATFGVVFMDRLAVNYLAPFVVRDLKLSATQFGLISSALSITWAVANVGAGRISDLIGRRKPLLIGAVVVFSVCSFVSGLATSFGMLIAARLFMGLAEGPVPPLTLTIMAENSSRHRIGLNTGLIQGSCISLFAQVLGPVVLIGLAQALNWRAAFWISAVPGLVLALIIARFVRERPRPPLPAKASPAAGAAKEGFLQIVGRRNILLCTAIACFTLAGLMIGNAFTTLYLVNVRHIPPTQASVLLSVQGVAGVVSFLVAAASDRIGRKPAVIGCSLLSLAAPLGLLYFHGPLWALALLLATGGLPGGLAAVLFVTIPAETVPMRQLGTVAGFIPGVGELIGSVCGPAIAGWAADRTSLAAPFLIVAGCGVAASLLGLGLQETLGSRPVDPLEHSAPEPAAG
jgi:MFS family permease